MRPARIAHRSFPLVVAALLAAALPTVVLAGSAAPAASGQRASAHVSQAACVRGSKACPIRIVFRHGAYTGQAHSSLTGQGMDRWFVVRARAGQTMVVVVQGAGATGGTVYLPGGGQDGQPGGRVFDGPLPTTGDYRIRVTESLMAEPWVGRVDVVVLIY